MIELFTIGLSGPTSSRWERCIRALKGAKIEWLMDIRHSPCASDPNPDTRSAYGPRLWNLQMEGQGIVQGLRIFGIEYLWVVELGNPQKRDPGMCILREHLAQKDGWPVHRGLSILRRHVLDDKKRCCLLCACTEYASCHRSLIAEGFRKALEPEIIKITDLTV